MGNKSPLVTFYREKGTDHRGRRFSQILAWDDAALEAVHDYIQWLFPLDEPSAFNPEAPLVTIADREAFANDPALTVNLERAFRRMLGFYGLRLEEDGEGGPVVSHAEAWPERSRAWLTPHNHNYLRLTRIMKSLTLLGRPGLARALGDRLTREYEVAADRIGPTTFRFWRAAVG